MQGICSGELLQLRSEDESGGKLAEWIKKKSSQYTYHGIQNELLQVMALHILRSLIVNIQSSKFTLMRLMKQLMLALKSKWLWSFAG